MNNQGLSKNVIKMQFDISQENLNILIYLNENCLFEFNDSKGMCPNTKYQGKGRSVNNTIEKCN